MSQSPEGRSVRLPYKCPVDRQVIWIHALGHVDGYEVCSQLKLDPKTKDIPVIFLTGRTHVEEETRGFDVGAVDYIHKPFSPAVVRARVQTHLALRGTREQLARQLLTIQKELETARKIQLSILPSGIPKIEGLDIAARYVPMTSVAGDFYDFIVVDEKHIGILVADVSGHGMPAALIASMLKIALSTQGAHAADSGASAIGPESSAVRKVPGAFRHGSIPVPEHGKANADLRWCRSPALAVV
jgi:phosphoserine phosphatase RsbU/P